MLNFGLIGCGTHARWAVLSALAQSDCCELRAVADIVPAHLTAPEVPDVARYTDYREMLAKEKLDAVYVATPCEVHCAPTVAALEAGCHVVCEKPMGMSEDECRLMLTTAETAGKWLAIDFENRYLPGFRQVRQWIADGKIGDVFAVHIDHMWDGHKNFGNLAERRKGFLQRTGCLDCGIHSLDIARFFVGGGAWSRVHALGAWCGEEVNFAPHIAILAELTPGIIVTLNTSFAYTAYISQRAQYEGFAILGSRGVIALQRDANGQDVFYLTGEAGTEECPFGDAGHGAVIPHLLADFAAAIRGENPSPSMATGYDGLMAQLAVDAANREAVEKRTARVV